MDALQLSIVAFCSTSAGGLCALGLRRRLEPVLAFTAGVLLGLVFLDLVPESFELPGGEGAMPALVAGFLFFHALASLMPCAAKEGGHAGHRHERRIGLASASALALHSLMDGIGIGLAFQVSPALGLTVAAAVIVHDFCDGLNTVGLMLLHRHPARHALAMLALDAAAPALGAASTRLFELPATVMPPALGFLAGFLLHLATSELPRRIHAATHSGAERAGLVGLTVLGAAVMYAASRLGG